MFIDRITFEGPSDALAWKWRPRKGSDDAIRLGSQLIVHESHQAIFFKGGQALDLFDPGTHTLSTGNLPLLSRLINLPFGGETPFTAEVWYVNKAVSLSLEWGTATPVMLLDPRLRVSIPMRGYGSYAVRVGNAREFLVNLVGTAQGALADRAADALNGPIIGSFQQVLGDYMVNMRISALELPAHCMALAKQVLLVLAQNCRSFGVELVNFVVESINYDHDDPSVVRMRKMLDEAARLELMGDASRRNIDFYRMDKQFEVLKSAAEHPQGHGLVEAVVGMGMGLGISRPASELAKEAMSPLPQKAPTCPKCGKDYSPGLKFCTDCGTRLGPAPVHCVHCGAENVPTSRFCVNCGKAVSEVKCGKCGVSIPAGSKFCGQCGEKV